MRYFGKEVKYSILFIPIILLLVIAVPAMAISYYANILVQETSGTNHGVIGLIEDMNISNMVSQGFINSDGRDVQVALGGTETKRMLADNYLLFTDNVTAYQSDYYTLSTNNTVEDFSIITGYGGKITTADNASLEPANSFSVNFTNIDLNTDNGTSKYLLNKFSTNGTLLYVSPTVSGEIDCNIVIPSAPITVNNNFADATAITLSSAFFTRGGERFSGLSNIIGVNRIDLSLCKFGSPTGTANCTVRDITTGSLLGIIGTINVSTLNTYPTFSTITFNTPITFSRTTVRVQLEYSGGSGANYVGVSKTDAGAYANGNACYYNAGTYTELAGADITWQNFIYTRDTGATVSLSGITTGEHDIIASLTGGTLSLNIDGTSNTTAFAGSIPDNSSNFTFIDGTTTPFVSYVDSISYSVSGVQQLLYLPNAIVLGTNLPDRSGNSHNGMITWGSNPSGINVQTGYLQFDESTVTGQKVGTPDSVDVLNAPDNMSIPDSDMKMTYNIFYFMVNWLSGVTDIDVVMIWWWISAALSIATLVLIRRFLNSIWAAGILSAIVSGAFVAMGMNTGSAGALEFWNPIVIVIATAFVGVWLRTSEAG